MNPEATEVEILTNKDFTASEVTRVTESFRFAFRLMASARLMAHKARAATSENSNELQPFVTAAIVLAYSFLEAGLNEFIYLNATADKSPLNESQKAIIEAMRSEDLLPGRQNTLQRFNLLLRILKKEALAANSEPYQAAEAVRSLRNLLVHPKPGRVTTFSNNPKEELWKQQQITKQLRSYLELDRSATFPGAVLTAKCAGWAVESCEKFFDGFVRRSGVSPGFITDGRI